MLQLAGGVALDTQQSDWTQGVLDLWNIVLASSTRFPLSGTPDPASILVYLDGPPPGQVQPGQTAGVQILATNPNGSTNWSYDSTSNTPGHQQREPDALQLRHALRRVHAGLQLTGASQSVAPPPGLPR